MYPYGDLQFLFAWESPIIVRSVYCSRACSQESLSLSVQSNSLPELPIVLHFPSGSYVMHTECSTETFAAVASLLSIS